jgi:hypothetical protein
MIERQRGEAADVDIDVLYRSDLLTVEEVFAWWRARTGGGPRRGVPRVVAKDADEVSCAVAFPLPAASAARERWLVFRASCAGRVRAISAWDHCPSEGELAAGQAA